MRFARVHVLLIPLLSLVALACGGIPDPEEAFASSCNGGAVLACAPYEYAIVREASISPADVEVDDPITRLMIHVRYDRCDDAPGTHAVGIRALSSGSVADGGTGGSLLYLDEVRDNGTGGDATANDGLIDVTVDNFFFSPVPPSTDLTIRFEPNLADCTGGPFELAYRTGPTWTMP
jgi:hypothetical protein